MFLLMVAGEKHYWFWNQRKNVLPSNNSCPVVYPILDAWLGRRQSLMDPFNSEVSAVLAGIAAAALDSCSSCVHVANARIAVLSDS